MNFSVPASELINVVALAECVIFAVALLATRVLRSQANTILAAIFIIIATVKLDQLYQALGGLEIYPAWGFILSPIQWLILAALYFFVLAKVTPDFRFKKIHIWNLTPLVLAFLYYWFFYYRLPVEAKLDLVQGGGLGTMVNRLVVPLTGDFIQLGYLAATLQLLKRYGIGLRNWFSRIDDRNLVWIKRVVGLWMAIFLLHMALTLILEWSGRGIVALTIFTLMNLMQFILINGLMFAGVVSHFKDKKPFSSQLGHDKYAGSQQTAEERKALYAKIMRVMETDRPYFDPNFNLGQLADLLAATPRDVSESINGEGGKNFYDFANSYRIVAAQKALKEEPERGVLEVAYAVGFNSKSSFNAMFRKLTGKTPSQFKKSL